jgi:acetylornithine deacetylase
MTIASDISRQLASLVSFPTVSAVSNLDLLKYVEDQTAPFGARVRRFANPEGDKANVQEPQEARPPRLFL